MSTERYETFRNRCLNELGLSSEDVGDPICLDLFGSVLETYSRFRGLRKSRTITKQDGVMVYNLEESEFEILEVLWNYTYPAERFLLDQGYATASEEFHNPSLRIVDLWKLHMQEYLADEVDQEYQDTYDALGNRTLVLDSAPTTNIIVIYRELFTVKNYPRGDESVIVHLFKSMIIGYVLGVPQIRSKGDVTFSIADMKEMMKDEAAKFYGKVQTMVADRS